MIWILYAVGGSYEVPPNHAVAQDRLFINNGKGNFKLISECIARRTDKWFLCSCR